MRPQLLELAWRNTLRNPRRTALTLVAFALGVAALVCAWSVFDGGNEQMIGTMTGNHTGYVQVHRRGYVDDPTVDRTFGVADVAAMRTGEIPAITAVAPRMEALALLSSDSNARALQLVGIDPVQEPQVTALHHRLSAGRYFQPGERGGIMIGRSLARMLGVEVDGELAVLTQGMAGSIGAQRYRVQAIYDTGNDMVDGMKAFIAMADADELLGSQGRMTTLAIRLAERGQTDGVVRALGARAGVDFEVEGWQALLPEVAQSVGFHEAVGRFVTLVLFGIVACGVANTVLMSVLERRREFGVMMAVGTSPGQVFRLVICEGLILGLLGFAIGLAIGWALVAHFGGTGIDFTRQGDAIQNMQGVSRTIHPHLGLDRMLYIGAAVLGVTLLASVYPAWKIARMRPLQAMHGQHAGGAGVAAGASRRGLADRLLPLLALRNLRRHPLRGGITLFAIAFGLGAFVFVGSIANGFYAQIVDNATGMVTGDAQVQHKDFKDDMKPTLPLPDGPALLERLRQADSVAGASPRVQVTAMVTSATRSLPLLLIGVDPDAERQVTFLDKSVKEGRYLRAGAGRDKEIVIGRKLAALLHVQVGERVIVMTQDTQGQLAAERFVVSGLFHTGSHSFDDVMGHVSLPVLQKMAGMDERITNIVLRMKARTPEGVSDLREVAALVPPGDARLLPWQELAPAAAQMNALFKGALGILLAIVLMMVSVVVVNTVLMSVMERTREFGTMLALGSRPGLVVRLVQLEAALMGLGGTVAGLLLGVLLAAMHGHGIDMKMHGAAIPGVTNIVFPKLSPEVLAVPGVLLPLLTLAAALYPAWRAGRLDPVRAMRHV